MTAAPDPDESLMRQVARGRGEALEPLVRRYSTPLLTFLRRMVIDRHQSEELFQDTFVAVWVKRRTYRYPRPFRPWLFAIAANKVRAALRRKRRDLVPLADPADGGRPPEDTAATAETATLVVAAVGKLPPKQRAVVALRVWEGLSYADIAGVTDSTEVTVRSHMHHALAALRRELDPHLTV